MVDGKMIAVVGMGAILPDAQDVASFWNNILSNKYSITDVPADRWNVDLYYDPDPAAVDKTYSKIGAFVRDYKFDPFKLGLAIPPKVQALMDLAQQWAIAATAQALKDYGYPERKLDPERVAIILGNANAGESQYRSTFRILVPEYNDALRAIPDFAQLPAAVREAILNGVTEKIRAGIPVITEDTMPGELSNIIAGRVANVFNFSGPNFVTDAACASSMAAVQAAVDHLLNHKVDAVLTGGIDHHMGPESYIKFCKIGALSADGSRPYAEGANGFVMGEGGVVMLLKRLEDAERDGDRIYAVIRGIGGSSDGKGKGITAPNPLGQQRALERAWRDAGINPNQVGLVEGHGTSTKVGDVAEVNSLNAIFGSLGLKSGAVALGSVKSNIGHLKSAAGAVGLLKTILALHHHVLPPSANFERPNPNIDFAHLPFRVNSTPQEWSVREGNFRFAGVSSFGFGGTNFHIVLEEYFPGISGQGGSSYAMPKAVSTAASNPVPAAIPAAIETRTSMTPSQPAAAPVNSDAVKQYVLQTVSEKTGYPVEMLDMDLDLEADLGIDTVKQAELFATVRTNYGIPRKEDLRLADYNTLAKVVQFVEDALAANPGQTAKIEAQPAAAKTTVQAADNPIQPGDLQPYQGLYFASADSAAALKSALQAKLAEVKRGMIPASYCPSAEELSRSERIAIDYADHAELEKRMEKALSAMDMDTPAAWKAMQAHGVFRGSGEPGKVAFLFPGQGSQYVNMLLDLRETEPVVKETFDEADRVMTPILGRPLTSFIYTMGGEEEIKQAEQELKNTAITQPAMLTANVAVLRVLRKYGVEPDLVIGHSLGEYAALVAAGVLSFGEALEVVSARGQEMTKIKVADPGCMAAVSAPLEKVEDVIRSVEDYVVIANINSPLQCVLGGTTQAIDTAIAKFTAEGYQAVKIPVSHAFHTKIVAPASSPLREVIARMDVKTPQLPIVANVTGELYPTTREEILDLLAAQVASPVQFVKGMQTLYAQGARIFIESGPKRVLNALASDNLKDKEDVTIIATNHPRKGGKASFNEALCSIYAAGIPRKQERTPVSTAHNDEEIPSRADLVDRWELDFTSGLPITGSVVISGAGLGLPGRGHHVFEDNNVENLLNGDMRIEQLPEEARQKMLEKHVTRLVKSEAGAVMEEITDLDQTLKLAGQGGEFDLVEEFGVPQERVEALDASTQLAIAAGIEALHDAGIPLVMHYRRTSKGTYLPDRWKLPEAMQDETGVVFASAFPGLNRMADEADRFYETRILEGKVLELRATIDLVNSLNPTGQTQLLDDLQRRIYELENRIEENKYQFDRRFVFRVLSMGHSQFAEYIGARGPNTHVNTACATTTHAMAIAEDWIRAGRCRRVVVIAGDDVTNPTLVSWIGTSLFASGAATTEGNLRMAALPFDKRRNGMIMGMGAAALVVESEDAARERGVRAIGEILSTHIANSAFHGTRLDVQHVSEVMDHLLTTAETRYGIKRDEIAPQTVFVSHETYTPARGGSASAEIHALRHAFKEHANQVIVANTKGYTGHSMGVGIEDVLAIKALETGKVPPIAHILDGFEPDPELGDLNLSKGGVYNPQYALRLGAGFGSQIAMTLVRRIPGEGERINRERYDQWLAAAAGYTRAELEVVQRTLRIKSQGVPEREPARSTWKYGQVPSLWATVPEVEKTVPFATAQVAAAQPKAAVEPAPVHAAAAPVAAVSSTAVSADDAEIKEHVLAVVSEKTGYPVEMLDLDLDLEADLGIDTVKQAELFAAIRTHYGIPRKEDLRLSDYNTLAKVVGFVRENLGGTNPVVDQPVQTTEPASAEPVKAVETAAQPVSIAPAAADNEEIKAYVLQVVSEKTGYPMEMLDLDLDLEADLGIDTVKQAELFAAIRTHYGIPRREDLILADYNTLAKVVGFMRDATAPVEQARQPEPVAASTVEKAAEASAQAGDEPAAVESSESQPELTPRVPIPVLLPRLDLCQPSGVTLAGNRVVVINDAGKFAATLAKKLKAAGAEVLTCAVADLDQKLAEWTSQGGVAGVYYLPGLDADPAWDGRKHQDWSSELTRRAHSLYALARSLPESAFMIAATRMGGLHGFVNPANPLGGAVSGFMKALKQERPNQFVKVIDFDPNAAAGYVTEELIAETLHDAVTCEVGRENELRYAVTLQEQASQRMLQLREGSVFVVSGGTGGITGPVMLDLAKATRGSFYLMGRTNLPGKDDPDLVKLSSDRNAFKLELQERLKTTGEKVTPVMVEQKLAALERAAATRQVMADIEAAGGKAIYLQCDVTDPAGVEQAILAVKKAEKRVDVFIHAAGLEKSRKIDTKTSEEFDQVVSVKADGFMNTFCALENSGLLPQKVVFFSSVAGRFGNSGQTDYAAANDLLSKYAMWLPVQYPGLQVLSIDWGAWAEVGMASRGHIPELMKRAGIDMLHPDEAAPMVRRLLEAGQSGEVVIAGSLGLLDAAPAGSEILNVSGADDALRAGTPIHTMFSHLVSYSRKAGICLEAEMDPEQLSYLRDHAINGVPVLPGVVGIEGFSVAAKHIASVLASGKAGFEVERLENIQFHVPFKFYGSKPRTITWHAAAYRKSDELVVKVSLESDMTRRNGNTDHVLHFEGLVFLTQTPPSAEAIKEPPTWSKRKSVSSEEIYQLYFHGPSFQVLDAAQLSQDAVLGKFNKKLVNVKADEPGLAATPLLIELCFQTAGLWEAGATGVLALPQSIGTLKLYRQPVNGVAIYAEVKPRECGGQISFDARVVDAKGNVFLELSNYRTSPLPYPAQKEAVEPMKALVSDTVKSEC